MFLNNPSYLGQPHHILHTDTADMLAPTVRTAAKPSTPVLIMPAFIPADSSDSDFPQQTVCNRRFRRLETFAKKF